MDKRNDQEQLSLEQEFAELDYRPKSKRKLIVPLLVVLAALAGIYVGVNYLLNDQLPEPVSEPEIVVTEPQEETEPEEDEPEEEPEPEEEETAEPVIVPTTPPDYDILENDLHNWLIERTGDGSVIMLHTDVLEDVERFFERYDLTEDNIIVYRVDSTEDEFTTVLFGAPFSEWSTRVVFIWRDDHWDFLREEAVR